MKKKLLISLLPVLMALSACGGAIPAEAPNGNPYFEEDALAHDEDFSKGESTYINKSFRNLTPVDPTVPLISVQRSDEYDVAGKSGKFVSVRFVAAVPKGQETSSMVWTRSMFNSEGTNVVVSDTYTSTHPYTLIHDGVGTLDISNFYGGAYGCFITYTLRKISVSYNSYFLKASLSIGGVAATKEVATTIDLSNQTSFPINQEGYFLNGTFDGNPDLVEAETTTPTGNNARFVYSDFKANDLFYVCYNHVDETPKDSKFLILDSSCLTPFNPYFIDDGTTANKIKVVNTHSYSFNINTSNHLTDIEVGYTVTYTNTSDNLVTVPLVFNGYSSSHPEFTANITPQTGSTVVFKYDGSALSSVEGESGANIEEDGDDLKIITGGSEIEIYLKDLGDDDYSVWVNYPKVTVNIYIKGWGENKSDFWAPTTGVYVYAHVYTDVEKLFYAVTYVDTYDSGYTVHYTVELPSNIASGHSLLMLRGPQSEVPEVPTTWPTGHVYNQTNGASIYYLDSMWKVETSI